MKDKTITFTVKDNYDISEEDFIQELLLTEQRMNVQSKLRFHLQAEPVLDRKDSQKSGGDALHKFQRQYPKSNSGDLQTFALAWGKAEEYFLPIIESYKRICQLADVPKLLIEEPGILKFSAPNAEDIEWAKKEIAKLKS